MTMKLVLVICLYFVGNNIARAGFPNLRPKLKSEKNIEDNGNPLILTSYLEANKIDEARELSKVELPDLLGVRSYSGYFNVNKEFNSNMFFWFFPSENDFENDPVVLWLQGGPGSTSMFALFSENGPLEFTPEGDLKLTQYSWTKNHSVIYIDNPVGTGWSFTDTAGFVTNQTQVGENLYNCLQQFFTLFPELRKNEFFVTGESYAGKYIPAVTYTIHNKNKNATEKINLAGLAIGNGLCDPINQLKYSDYLYQIGLVDSNGREGISEYEALGRQAIEKEDYKAAFYVFDELLNGDLTPYPSYFKNLTGISNYYNYLIEEDTSKSDYYMTKFFERSDVKKAIHVGNMVFDSNNLVEIYLLEDVMKSIAPWLTVLINNYRVLIYNGQLDIIVAYPLTVNYLKVLEFDGNEEYKTAPRKIWKVNDEIAGYVKTAGNLTEVLVRNAGHMVPADQPKWGLDLISKFMRNVPLS